MSDPNSLTGKIAQAHDKHALREIAKQRRRETPYDTSKVGGLLAIAADFGVYPGAGGGLKAVRRFFRNAENHANPPCPRCGPQERRTRRSGDTYRCRGCGHRFMPEVLAAPVPTVETPKPEASS